MLVPVVDMGCFEHLGFKKCKRPYNMCYYKCFARGCQYIFISPEIVDICDWYDDDPRIHKKANCKYLDNRTALDFLTEMIQAKLVDCQYFGKSE